MTHAVFFIAIRSDYGIGIFKTISPALRGYQWILLLLPKRNSPSKADIPDDCSAVGGVRPLKSIMALKLS
jgi:hypothetical protein